jgi:beta-galactosidase
MAAELPRQITPLTDRWLFQFADSESASLDARSWDVITVPHTWNIADGSQSKKPYRRGIGHYQRAIAIPDDWRGRSVFLTVGAANAKAVVSWNGEAIAEHRTGFTAFTVDVTARLRPGAEQDLHVTVDNRHNLEYPPLVSDYTFFGGIHRAVWLTSTDPVHVSLTHHSSAGVYLVQKRVSHERAEVEAQVEVANDLPGAVADARVAVDVLDHAGMVVVSTASAPLALAPRGSIRVVLPFTLDRPRLWDGRDDPYCYRARVRVLRGERISDEVVQPLGLRFFSVDSQRGFLLNGRSYDLHGTSLHQDHAGKGWAISDVDRATDVGLLQELGATCVRLVHYPHAPATLDLLDRAGIVAWSEIPIAYRMGKAPEFEANCRTMLTEMICQLHNHPSICFWGLYNEISTLQADALPVIRRLDQVAKDLDPGRLTTGSAGAVDQDPICDATDVVAFHRYFGWFLPGANLFSPWAAGSHRLFPERKIGVSEYGGEGDPARHADHRTAQSFNAFGRDGRMGTEEHQTQLHEELWLQMANKPYLWCKLSWSMADWATGGIKAPSLWPSDGLGRMGLVTNDRRTRKDVFYWYKANWSKEPVLHIAERRFTPRQFREFDLRVYSNLKTALTVTVNGAAVAAPPDIHGVRHLWPDLRAPAGRTTVTVTAQVGGRTLSDSVAWDLPDVLPIKSTSPPGDAQPKPEPKPDF